MKGYKMGLDTTHGCWHGAYSAFGRWRDKLAEVTDIPLNLMEGFYGFRFPLSNISQDLQGRGIPPFMTDRLDEIHELLPIKWSSLKYDVLHELLHHSDCDGELSVDILEPLADRLEELLPLLDGDGGGHIGSYRKKTQQFIDGLRLAHSLNEPVEFH